MNIDTKYHGVIEVEDNDFIYFENGIPGFLEEKYFILLPLEKDSPFNIMQSKVTPELGFAVVNPFLFFQDYEFDLTANDKEALSITTEEDIQILSILTIKDPFSETTANLQAPVVININKKVAKQIILHETYKTKHKIFRENSLKGK